MKLSMKNIAKLYDSYDLIDYVKYENCVLTKKGKSLEKKLRCLKIN
jgi:Mn-dependent DtxR family transcriptional regulator